MAKKPSRPAQATPEPNAAVQPSLPGAMGELPRLSFSLGPGLPTRSDSLHEVHAIQSLDTLINEFEKREHELRSRKAEGRE